MTRDQYTFHDPRTLYPNISPDVQQQPEPGLQSLMTPVPDLGEETYRGTGRLTGRRALITGADSGIGAAVAIAYAREGADIALSYLPEEQEDADHVVAQIEAAGRRAVTIPGDITSASFCRELVATAAEKLGGLDTVVNVAGKQVWHEKIEDIDDERLRRHLPRRTSSRRSGSSRRPCRTSLPARRSSTRRRSRRTSRLPTGSTTRPRRARSTTSRRVSRSN